MSSSVNINCVMNKVYCDCWSGTSNVSIHSNMKVGYSKSAEDNKNKINRFSIKNFTAKVKNGVFL